MADWQLALAHVSIVCNLWYTHTIWCMTRLNPICVCTMNMCHKPVHDLVRICTSNHAHHISSLYAHDPHHAHLVEIVCIWHIVVEIILHDTRLDLLILIIVEIGVSVNYKDSYYLYILWVLCGFCDKKIRLWVDKSPSLWYARLAHIRWIHFHQILALTIHTDCT